MVQDYSLYMDLSLGKLLGELPGPILITGHTGFKGTWLTFLMESLNIPTIGLSLPPEENSLFSRSNRLGKIPEEFIDIRNAIEVNSFIIRHRPSAIIHMAAQPLVMESYKIPEATFDINIMGTVNVLSAAFKTDFVQAVLVVTTDKVYRNDNSGVAFIEEDPLEGKDPYSASKVGTEAAVAAWQQISKVSGGPSVISVRAGNVIGGGDWAKNRLLPDLIRGFISGGPIQVRNPESRRPWQHVLDPLHGYILALAAALQKGDYKSFNFGPSEEGLTVKEVVEISTGAWYAPISIDYPATEEGNIEASNLQLDSEKARSLLKFNSRWSQEAAIIATIEWWNQYINFKVDPVVACKRDISFLLRNI